VGSPKGQDESDFENVNPEERIGCSGVCLPFRGKIGGTVRTLFSLSVSLILLVSSSPQQMDEGAKKEKEERESLADASLGGFFFFGVA
jgi:hypothetical protein